MYGGIVFFPFQWFGFFLLIFNSCFSMAGVLGYD